MKIANFSKSMFYRYILFTKPGGRFALRLPSELSKHYTTNFHENNKLNPEILITQVSCKMLSHLRSTF